MLTTLKTHIGNVSFSDAKNILGWLHLGILLRNTDQLEAAESIYREGVQNNPKNPFLWDFMGVIYAITDRLDEV